MDLGAGTRGTYGGGWGGVEKNLLGKEAGALGYSVTGEALWSTRRGLNEEGCGQLHVLGMSLE